tara:strand:- start:137 stop:454 length:318 start_codon:yes stop_codon:yes gene_type:complete
MVHDLILGRLNLGKSKYGHGVRVCMNTMSWGTPRDSWMHMAIEEFLDALIYTAADYIRKFELPGDPDDNTRILEVILNPQCMMSSEHIKIILTLKDLVEKCLAMQ